MSSLRKPHFYHYRFYQHVTLKTDIISMATVDIKLTIKEGGVHPYLASEASLSLHQLNDAAPIGDNVTYYEVAFGL